MSGPGIPYAIGMAKKEKKKNGQVNQSRSVDCQFDARLYSQVFRPWPSAEAKSKLVTAPEDKRLQGLASKSLGRSLLMAEPQFPHP